MLTSLDVKFICDSACLLASLRDKGRGTTRNFLLGRSKTLVQKGLLNFFCGKLVLTELTTCSSISDAGRGWCGKFYFVIRGEQIIGGYPKTITFFNILGI